MGDRKKSGSCQKDRLFSSPPSAEVKYCLKSHPNGRDLDDFGIFWRFQPCFSPFPTPIGPFPCTGSQSCTLGRVSDGCYSVWGLGEWQMSGNSIPIVRVRVRAGGFNHVSPHFHPNWTPPFHWRPLLLCGKLLCWMRHPVETGKVAIG